MSRKAAFSPAHYHPKKKVERLYFPQYGDPALYDRLGRKHFQHSTSPDNPFSPFSTQEKQMLQAKLLQPEEEHHHKRLSNPFVPTSRPSLAPPNLEIAKGRMSEQKKNDMLDQQVANFNLNAKLQQHRKTPTDVNLRQRRAHTDHVGAEETHVDNSLMPKLPEISRTKTRTRLRTEAEPVVRPVSFQPRFNPTFLSSLNY